MNLRPALPLSLLAASLAAADAQPPQQPRPATGRIEYSRDVQPILATNCFTCHGPDDKSRKGGLRLDLAKDASKTLRSGARAVVPGDSKNSELVARIYATGREQMPPAKSTHQLKKHEKELLKRWIEQGAEYQAHWGFVAPKRPQYPTTADRTWAKSAIDHFILARLEKEGLKPAPEADRHTLARRLAIDLTGLPPTPEAADRFVNDKSPDAYEKYVEQLLHSSAYGERWAHVWLDLARYADSNGYAEDQPRVIWKYRDWVINAINKNVPFDRFTIEQIAGDLLPNPTEDQLLATAFHRNTLTNTEGGTDDEEFRTAAVVDRVNTTFQVWMNVTINCAQCHDHKYDPISQEEYFKVYAILNQTADSDKGDNSPTLASPTPEQVAKRSRLEKEIAALQKTFAAPEFVAARKKWEETEAKTLKLPGPVAKALAVTAAKRNAAQQAEINKFFASRTPEHKKTAERLTAAQKELAAAKIVTTPIMRELPPGQQRKTHIQLRGNFLDKGKEVGPGVPATFHPLVTEPRGWERPGTRPPNRLDLAKWLVSPDNPLTARVAVNRYWEQIFGVGLVGTAEDFGTRGKLPTHPELLDWLATEFQRHWDVRRLLKLLVTSATYRQSSRITPESQERDPDNRLFARGPRFRASAEAIRDQALFVSGLLSAKVGGPSVRPVRPKFGLTAAFGPGTDWDPSPGGDRHRRGLYTEWRRSTPYPSMLTFDAPERNVCTVTRPRTNTPLQALVTLNDPVYVEAAQALARRMVKEGGTTVESRVSYGFRLCLTRPPREVELSRLAGLYHKARERYAADAEAARQMATDPLGPLPPGMDAADLAAWTVVGNVLLNLDEMFAKR